MQMSRHFSFFQSIYLVYILAFVIFFLSFYIYKIFDETSEEISTLTLRSNIEYIDNVTSNIAQHLIDTANGASLEEALAKDTRLREYLEHLLEVLVTKRYRYIYVVDKDAKGRFRLLLDGAKVEKGTFLEMFQPVDAKRWLQVYEKKKPTFFQHKEVKGIWMTYLKPVLINGRVIAVIAIDFSLKEQQTLQQILQDLAKVLGVFITALLFVLLMLIVFAYIDRKRVDMLTRQAEEIKNFNITLRQKVKEEVAKNREKDKKILEQSRLAQMGEMIGMIAHQWRQPISAISATAITIMMKAKMDMLSSKEAAEYAEKISELTQELSKTIDDFRDFFKPTKERKSMTYKSLVEQTLNIVEVSLHNKNIDIIVELESDVKFCTYTNELKQVLLNLIKNAEDILIEKKVENPYIKISAKGNRLCVRDNGGGIPKEIEKKIFDPYFSTKSKNGTGLGLYMSKIIVEEHCGGKLLVSNDEKGAVFVIELPPSECE